MSRATMTRRGFLKSTAAMGAAGALGISAADSLTAVDPAHADEASDVKIVKTSCRACIASCAVLAHVRDGRVVKIEGNPESPMSQGGVCAKGLAGIQALYHPNRNKYPMRRVGERGSGEFERITWDEAIAEIAEKWKSYREEFGPTSIAFFLGSGNTGTLGGGAPEGSVMARLLNVMGASRVLPDRDIATPMAWAYMFGAGPYGNRSSDAINAKHHVIWGGDTAVSQKQLAHFFLEARDAGTELVVIDIAYRTMASKSDWFIPVHPATDGALALGAIREIFEQG